VISLLVAVLATSAVAETVAVPPASYRPSPTGAVQAPASLLTPDSAPSFSIRLSAPTVAEKASVKAAAGARAGGKSGFSGSGKGGPLQIGFARSVPGDNRPLDLTTLSWIAQGDGGSAARIAVTSPGAAAIRVAVVMNETDPDVSVRFAGSGGTGEVFGPYPANQIAGNNPFWSPVLEGETATLEIYLPPGVTPSKVQLALPQVSHLVAAAQDLLKAQPVDDIGKSGSCEKDVACIAPTTALTNQARAVAKMIFTLKGNTYTCTGTLINDSIVSNTAYFYTANHCIDSQATANTLVTYWFFKAVTCGSLAVPPYQTVVGGARLLGRSTDYDWVLLRLNGSLPTNPPPVFSAWRADTIANSTLISVLHHANGDLLKFSQGTMPGYVTFDDGSSFASARYTLGSTEPGSIGSGLLTLGAGGTFYELRGGLFGSPTNNEASCANPNGVDWYSRIDNALPLVSQYLTPGAANPAKKTLVVEYYYPTLDDYFITADPREIAALDAEVGGWVRTGLTFLAYSDPVAAPADASPVCRYYVLPQYGDSHVYSADPAECALIGVRFGNAWVFESAALFYIQLPDKATGACPVNTRPVYRFLNKANQVHHRYLAEVDDRNCLYYGPDADVDLPSEPDVCTVTPGTWILEGYGTPPNQVVMCSPVS